MIANCNWSQKSSRTKPNQSVGQFNCQIANEASNLLVSDFKGSRDSVRGLPDNSYHEGGSDGRVASPKFKVLAGNANIMLRVPDPGESN